MITISTKQKQFELQIRFSIEWLQYVAGLVGELLCFADVREIEERKRRELHKAGLYLW